MYDVGYVTVKDLIYATPNSIRPLYLIINKMNGYIEESNENKILTLVLTDESKDTPKKYEGLWKKIKNLIRTITNRTGNYDKKIYENKILPICS